MAATAFPGPRKAEHLGSLLRPAELLDYSIRNADDDIRRQIEDQEISEIVNEQLQLGFHSISDGEYRRSLFWGSFFDNLKGFESFPMEKQSLRTYFPDIKALLESPWAPGAGLFCTGKIRHPGISNHLDEFLFLKSVLGPGNIDDIKITMPAPSWYHIRHTDGASYAQGVYNSDFEYFNDLAAVYQKELQLLYDAGLRRVQIDDPHLSYLCSPQIIAEWDADSKSIKTPTELLDTYIDWYNLCFSQVPQDMHIGIHICRGNFSDERYVSTGGYDLIASQIFQKLNVRTYYLEYDTERAGSFEPLKDLPVDKHVVLGVITTKSADLEDIEGLKRQVYKAADFVASGNNINREAALQRLSVSPQCGFASHSREDRLSREDMLKKLRLVRDLASSIWPNQA